MSIAADLVLPSSEDEQRQIQARRLNDGAMQLRDDRAPSAVCLSILKRASNLDPHYHPIKTNLGLVYWDIGDLTKAREMFEAAVEGDPTNHRYHGNLGVFASAIANPELAEKHLSEAIRLTGGSAAAKWDHALLQLWQGKWDAGLAEYESRREHRGPELYPNLPYPMWNGEPLDGKSIYIQGEQGVGDRILFSRYIAWLKDKWPSCAIYTHMHDSMVNLMWHYFTSGVVEMFMPNAIPWPEGIDYSCYLQSLPKHHGSQRDTFVPPDPGFIRDRTLQQRDTLQIREPLIPSLKVGICWTGNPVQTRNSDRSIPLELMVELAEDPRIQLYGIQVGPGNKDLDRCRVRDLVVDLAPEIEKDGWIRTAQLLMRFDAVITVCTSVAHLAGALGVNCWTLLCNEPYWVWPRSGSTTGWYPSMRLFRQTQHGAWRPVIEQVKAELGKLADGRIGSL